MKKLYIILIIGIAIGGYYLTKENFLGVQRGGGGTEIEVSKVIVQLPVSTGFSVVGASPNVYTYIVPSTLNNFRVTSATAAQFTSSSLTTTIDINKYAYSPTGSATTSFFTTTISIDANETSTLTAATSSVINTSAANVYTGNILIVDIDATGNNPPQQGQGLLINLTFEAPL